MNYLFVYQVYFGGYFLRNRSLSMHTISFSIKYWSRGAVQSLFLRHEGYLGAIGAFLRGTEECGNFLLVIPSIITCLKCFLNNIIYKC